jgi:23S rRNA (guanosine2251-2'-O)-methyltransferase
MRERDFDHRRRDKPDNRRRNGPRKLYAPDAAEALDRGHSGGRRSGKLKAAPWRGSRSLDTAVLYGWHTVKAALANPQRRFHRLLATENAIRRLTEDKVPFPIAPTPARPEDIAAVAGANAVHQGLYAEADALESPELEDVVTGGIVLVLDQVTDPHNFGAILRSAAAFAVAAVITTERHSPQASGVLAKAASGALEYVPMVTVVNLARALDDLRDLNALVVGLDSGGDADLGAMPLSAPLALVVGAEGKGLRHLTRARCDAVARLALPGRITSLNVSNATAVALYVASAKLAALLGNQLP